MLSDLVGELIARREPRLVRRTTVLGVTSRHSPSTATVPREMVIARIEDSDLVTLVPHVVAGRHHLQVHSDHPSVDVGRRLPQAADLHPAHLRGGEDVPNLVSLLLAGVERGTHVTRQRPQPLSIHQEGSRDRRSKPGNVASSGSTSISTECCSPRTFSQFPGAG